MRKILFSAVALLALAFLSCNKSELEPTQETVYTIKATIDNYGTKSAMNGNTVTWVLNEEVALFKSNGDKIKATVTEVNGVEATLTLEAGKTADGVVAALYPYSDDAQYSNNEITTNLAKEYTWVEGENNKAPMAALVTDVRNISFKNAGALIALTVNNIPAGYNSISLSSGIAINGATEISFNNNGIPSATVTASADVSANKKTAINFTATEIATNKVFYFPIGATETNTDITIELSNGTTTQELLDNHAMAKAVRNTRYYKTINFDALGELPTQLTSSDNINTKMSSGNTNFILDASDNSVEITTETTSDVQIAVTSSGDTFTLQGEGPKGKVNLSTPAETQVLTLDVPNATVELKPDAGVATFEAITATTAENTLIIPAGVTVNNLTITGGNVRVFGKIVSITNSKAEGKVTVYKEKGAVIPELDSDKFTLVEVGAATVVKTVAELTEAISQATEGNVITLGGNLEMSEILAINKAITLDGKGYKLTSTAGRAINVTGVTNNVTIKNLVIKTTGERGINIIQNSKNVTIENVNIDASNYSVNVAASAPEATVTITKSKLTGKNTINIGANNTTMTVSDSELTTNDNNPSEGYGTISVSPYNAGESSKLSGSSVTVENCEFITSGTNANDTHNISYAPELSSVKITGKNSSEISIEEIKAILPVNENNFYGYETLEELIAKCNSGNTTDNTIILVGDVTVTQNITCNKNLTLDLNDYTMTIDTAADQGEWGLIFEGNTIIKNGKIVTKSRYPLLFNNETTKKEVTITDIVIEGNRNEGTNGNAGAIIIVGNANVTINNDVNISAKNYSCIIEGSSNDAMNNYAEININGGNFSLINDSSDIATVLGAGFGSTINVYNGVFDGTAAKFVASAYPSGGTINIVNGTFNGALKEYTSNEKTVEISITGGTFTVDPSEYLRAGYSATGNNGIWTVSATGN